MKKTLLMAAIACGIIVSCSGNDNENTSSEAVLLKKTVETQADGSVLTTDVTYNGTKISTVTYSNGSHEEITYSGDYITGIKTYVGTTLSEEEIFNYNSNHQLSAHIYKDYDANYGKKTLYTYTIPNTANTQDFTGTLASQTETESTGIITITADNITQYIYTYAGDSNQQVITYTYDTKNDPLKNITGVPFLNLAFAEGGVNNILTTNDSGYTSSTTYTYNTAGYPTQSTETDSYGETLSTQYFY